MGFRGRRGWPFSGGGVDPTGGRWRNDRRTQETQISGEKRPRSCYRPWRPHRGNRMWHLLTSPMHPGTRRVWGTWPERLTSGQHREPHLIKGHRDSWKSRGTEGTPCPEHSQWVLHGYRAVWLRPHLFLVSESHNLCKIELDWGDSCRISGPARSQCEGTQMQKISTLTCPFCYPWKDPVKMSGLIPFHHSSSAVVTGISETGIRIELGSRDSDPEIELRSPKWSLLSQDLLGVIQEYLQDPVAVQTFFEPDEADHLLKSAWAVHGHWVDIAWTLHRMDH